MADITLAHVLILLGLMWILAFCNGLEGPVKDYRGAALWSTVVFIPASVLFAVGLAGIVWVMVAIGKVFGF